MHHPSRPGSMPSDINPLIHALQSGVGSSFVPCNFINAHVVFSSLAYCRTVSTNEESAFMPSDSPNELSNRFGHEYIIGAMASSCSSRTSASLFSPPTSFNASSIP